MSIRVGSKQDAYGRLNKYYSLTAADRLPVADAPAAGNYFGDKSDSDVTISANTSLTSTLDGDIIVKNYGNLTIDAGFTLTTANRCRGLVLFVDGDLTVNGIISMTARGCHANPADAVVTADTPVAPGDANAVGPLGIRFPFLTASDTDTLAAAEFEGGGVALHNLIANFPTLATNGKIIAFPKIGGAGGAGGATSNGDNGVAGGVGDCGGGGGGGSTTGAYGGAAGTCFSGGSGGGGNTGGASSIPAKSYGGIGGVPGTVNDGSGAGNPAGTGGVAGENGTGGMLIIICSGTVTIGASGAIAAKGKAGGIATSSYCGGGATGGGNIFIAYGVAYSNLGTVSVAGGIGGAGQYTGGDGGAGSIQTLEISA